MGSYLVFLCAPVSVFAVPGSSPLTGYASGRDGLWNLPFLCFGPSLVSEWSFGLSSVMRTSFCSLPLCAFVCFFLLLVFWEPEQLSLTDEIVILVLDNQSSFWGNLSWTDFTVGKQGEC